MAGVTFKLLAAPTFRARVDIPAPGGAVVPLECEFRHFTRQALIDFSTPEAVAARTDVDTLMEVLADWHNVDQSFCRGSVALLLENYQQAAAAIVTAWMRELTAQRLGN